MKTIGQTLKQIREKKGISLATLSSQTAIQERFLHAIEENRFAELPSSVVAQAYLSRYASLLGVETATALAMLRRDFDVKAVSILPKALSEHRTPTSYQRTRTMWLAGVVVATLLTVGAYGAWTYRRLRTPPPLTITFPKDHQTVVSPLVIKGWTASDSMLKVDGELVSLNQDGEFAREVELGKGDHTISVVATNRYSQETKKQVTITVSEAK